MQIKTAEGMHNVTSQGQGTLNTVLGSIGTLSALQNNNNGCGNNGGLLGGLFGGNNNCNNNGDCYERKESALLREQIAILTSQNFSREAATQAFKDSVTFTDKEVSRSNAIIEKLSNAVIDLQTESAVLKSDIRCLSAINEKDHQAIIAGYTSAVSLEAERRKCGDDNIVAWTQGELYKKANYAQYINGSDVFCPQSNICGVIDPSCSCSVNAKSSK